MDIVRIRSCDTCPFCLDEIDEGGPLTCLHPRTQEKRDSFDAGQFAGPGRIEDWELEDHLQEAGAVPRCDLHNVPDGCPLQQHGACLLALEGQGVELGTVKITVPESEG